MANAHPFHTTSLSFKSISNELYTFWAVDMALSTTSSVRLEKSSTYLPAVLHCDSSLRFGCVFFTVQPSGNKSRSSSKS